MSTSFEALFAPSPVPLQQIVPATCEILLSADLKFGGSVSRLYSVNGGPEVRSISPDLNLDTADIAALIPGWWGCALDWFCPWSGDVYLSFFKAGPGMTNVIYDESRSAIRQRQKDPQLQEDIVAMLTKMMRVLESPICTYNETSQDFFKPPSLETVTDILRLGSRWQGYVLIVDKTILNAEHLAALAALEQFTQSTTDGKVILNLFDIPGGRSPF